MAVTSKKREIISFFETHYPKFNLHETVSKFVINTSASMPETELELTFQQIIDKSVENTHDYYKKKGKNNRVKHIGVILNGYGLGKVGIIVKIQIF